jgi:hypothetical protein
MHDENSIERDAVGIARRVPYLCRDLRVRAYGRLVNRINEQ